MKIKFLIILFLIVLISCRTNKKASKVNLIGNWSEIYKNSKTNQIIYQELYFTKDTMEVFDPIRRLHLPSGYELKKDSIYFYPVSYDTTLKGKIKIKNNNELLFEFNDWNASLKRIEDKGWHIDSLIKTGVDRRGIDEYKREKIYRNFIENQFWIREIKYRIYLGIENKDSLIKYWKKCLADSTIGDKYIYKNFLKNIE